MRTFHVAWKGLLGQGVRGWLMLALIPILLLFLHLTGLGSLILAIVIAAVSALAGATLRLYVQSVNDQSTPPGLKEETVTHQISSTWKKKRRDSRGKLDMRLSGSAIIDEIIHEMMDYVIRDYVHSWYDFVTDEDEFVHLLRKTMQETFTILCSRIKEVDWIPFLTTQLVDDGASHLRIYRTALEKVKENPNCDLLSVFFDLEAKMEENMCRDMSCIDESHLNDYFQGIAETILYLVLPQETYGCTPIGSVAQDLLVNYIFIPVLNLVSDPDFVNQYIIWMCQGFPVSSDLFLSVIRTSDSLEEMSAAHDFFQDQQAELKAALACEKGVSGDELSSLKQQLKCVNMIKKGVEQRLSKLKEGDQQVDWTDDGEQWQNYFLTPGVKLHSLSLEQVLKNNVSVSYFLDFMGTVGGTNYVLMYFNTAAWKSLAEQQFMAAERSVVDAKGQEQLDNTEAMMDCLKVAAQNVFEEFLSDQAIHKVRLPDSVVRRFRINLQTGFDASLFDDIHESLVNTLETVEKFYPSFIRSKHYIKTLMDLDLLRTESTGSVSDDEEEDLVSLDDYDISLAMSDPGGRKSVGEEYQTCMDCLKVRKQEEGMESEDLLFWEKIYLEKSYRLKAEIIEAGLTTEKGKQFGVYAIQVVRTELRDMKERRWHIYRRYSDFYDFHHWIKTKWMRLSKIEFPSKHTFRTTDRVFLERRMNALNKYLETILAMTSEQCFGESLRDALLHFFEAGNYMIKKKQFSEKIDILVNPLKMSVKSVSNAVKSAPDSFISGLDGFTKMFYSKGPEPEQIAKAMKVGASLDIELDDNIPLRIILLLMDEVFDLKQRNQWLRRRIVSFVKEILKAMFGDTMNRRIIDHVAFLTNPVKVSGYLRNLQRSLWPEGTRASAKVGRDNDVKMRTRVAAKAALFASISDELKRLIGSETTRRGLVCVFDLCQNRILNRRFSLVLLEGILKTLFPDKPLDEIIQRLHFRSNRVGKQRPFLVPSSKLTSGNANNMAHLSPRGSRKKKS